MPNYTPMMNQYFNIKTQYKHCLLFFRLGDFYELFFDDALTASKELDIALTGRDCGQKERAPMCGVPYHAVDGYIARLVEKGYHVAVCEQVEDPKTVKGIVKREVIRVVTPGTVTDANMLDENKNNYITCVHQGANGIGIASADITTGVFMVTSLPGIIGEADGMADGKLADELARLTPAELLICETFKQREAVERIVSKRATLAPTWTFHPGNAYKKLTDHFQTMHLDGYGLKPDTPEVSTAGALLEYLSQTQKGSLLQITGIHVYTRQTFMALDMASRRNLELTAALHGQSRNHCLLGVLNRTETTLGARLLRQWIEQPMLSSAEVNRRLDSVSELFNESMLRAELRELLHTIHDIERIVTKLMSRGANARDLGALKASLQYLPQIRALLADASSEAIIEIYRTFDDLSDIYARIHAVLVDDPPISVKEGGMIRAGVSAELDQLLNAKNNGANWLTELENQEREATGIKSLKIRYNKIFGYNIELTNGQKHLAPNRYIRRQTLANCERFVTEELKNLEDMLLGAEEKQTALEYDIFDGLRREVTGQFRRIQFTALSIAALDALQSLADTAERNRYCRPVVNEGSGISIKGGRHPVVEHLTEHAFIPNDTDIDTQDNRLSIITGPNMAGKSTYMRQVALIVLMAQIGSFVPAESAEIGVVDRIFTRVGASDDLATGRSTFMVEMTEVANILNNATSNSLILLDEIGRGTSTFDGLSIAWSVLEYIADKRNIGAKTLFATHYHELTELEGKVPGIRNYSIAVQEAGDEIVFLRKLVLGSADHSYGIHVARLAGLPGVVLERAREVLAALDKADITKNTKTLSGLC